MHALVAALALTALPQDAQLNTLTAEEVKAGFQLLFDGKTMDGWHRWKGGPVGKGWTVQEGAISYTPGTEGGDIATDGKYADFELRLEWRVAPAGNSGIFYRVADDGAVPWETGPEMQVLDDAGHPDGRSRMTSAGACYGLYPSPAGVVRPGGEWNQVRILAIGPKVEHWLNGVKVVEFEIGSEDFERRVKESKFKAGPRYGRLQEGRFVLQDHGDRVDYRNLRVRRIGA
jgi:hypothetical protein